MAVEQITAVTALIGAVTGMLWPVIAVGVLFAFRGPAMRALNRVSDDGGTIEVFGVKVNVGKATEEQQRLIEDVQQQLATLRDAIKLQGEIGPRRDSDRQSSFLDPSTLAPRPPAAPAPPPMAAAPIDDPFMPLSQPMAMAPHPEVAAGAGSTTSFGSAGSPAIVAPVARSATPRLLWVDDHPENNAVLMASLRNRGFIVVEALTTADALDRFTPGGFDTVISDMGRDTADAGVTLTERIRARDGDVPILIFCSIGARRIYGPFALRVGATLVTESQSVLMQHLLELQGGV